MKELSNFGIELKYINYRIINDEYLFNGECRYYIAIN